MSDDRSPSSNDRSPSSGDPWQALRTHTRARIALGRSGASLPTAPMLDFALAHARARDAVHQPFDVALLTAGLTAAGMTGVPVASRAPTREVYLRRPDLGRRLDDDSVRRLRDLAPAKPVDLVFVVADGLSTKAVHVNALPVLRLAMRLFTRWGWSTGPVVVASQARVALGDEVGQCLGARQVAVLIGERPGLSAADSLGIYLTWAPAVGLTDERRNCISNIHANGLAPSAAVHTLAYLAREAARRGLTGVALKDDSDRVPSLVEAGDVAALAESTGRTDASATADTREPTAPSPINAPGETPR